MQGELYEFGFIIMRYTFDELPNLDRHNLLYSALYVRIFATGGHRDMFAVSLETIYRLHPLPAFEIARLISACSLEVSPGRCLPI
jgi:hypothetical protein